MTNFDLSTYIRWLKPEANAAHETRTITDLQSTLASPTDYNPKEESKSPFLHGNPLVTDYINSPKKQEVFKSKNHFNACNKTSSSPTALGILLRSSVFKELVEKNSNISEDDTDGDEPMDRAQIGSDEDYGIFNDGIGDIPFICTSNRDSIELQERELHFLF